MPSYTEDFQAWIYARLDGQASGIASAEEVAAGLISRCFAMASVSGADAELFPVDVLMTMARELALQGESVWMNRAAGLTWVQNYSKSGTRYMIQGKGVSRNIVLHPRYNTERTTGRGISPLGSSPTFRQYLRQIEQRMEEESRFISQQILPFPKSANETGKTKKSILRKSLEGIEGIAGRVMPVFAGEKNQLEMVKDPWHPIRWGPEMTQYNVQAYQDSKSAALAALGVPQAVIGNDSAGMREGMRTYLHTVLLPYSRIIAGAAADIDIEVKFNFDELMAADIQGRARAYRALVGNEGNLDSDEALALIGVELEDGIS